MKLTSFQGELLKHVKLDADRPVDELARSLRTTQRQVRYHLDRLERSGIITRAPFINIYPLGLRYVNMYFSVAASRGQSLEQLLEAMTAHPSVTWLGELGGDFHYGVAFAVRGIEEIPAIVSSLSTKLVSGIFAKEFTTHLRLRMYPLKSLSPKRIAVRDLGYGAIGSECRLDELDKSVVEALSSTPGISQREIARTLKRSPATIDYRMARLKGEGILAGFWYRANFEALGLQSFKILVFSRSLDRGFGVKLEQFCRDHPRVDSFIECIGAWDYEIGVVAESPSDVGRVTREMNHLFGDEIHMTKAIPLLSVLKFRQLP